MVSLLMFGQFSSWRVSKGISQPFYNLCPSFIKKNLMFLWKLFYALPAKGTPGWVGEGGSLHFFCFLRFISQGDYYIIKLVFL